jgi:hypothetical protein
MIDTKKFKVIFDTNILDRELGTEQEMENLTTEIQLYIDELDIGPETDMDLVLMDALDSILGKHRVLH